MSIFEYFNASLGLIIKSIFKFVGIVVVDKDFLSVFGPYSIAHKLLEY